MSNRKDSVTTPTTSNTAQQHNLPADELLGVLEPVAYFNGAIPTGVTVSHQLRIISLLMMIIIMM
jgi:hypothetical protein